MIYVPLTNEINWNLRKWARYHLPHITYPMLAQMARKQQIKIDNKKIDLSHILTANCEIFVHDALIKPIAKKEINSNTLPQDAVIFENDDFIIIDKPYNVAAQGEENSIAQISNGYIVHRLDKTTTGVMLIAKNKLSASVFSEQLRAHKIRKQYLGICVKNEEIEQSGIWDSEIDGKLAQTEYNILKQNHKYALIAFEPITGKKHQIRKHCMLFGCPIVGDTKYNGPKANRIYLHSECIEFFYNNKDLAFVSKSNFNKEFDIVIKE